MISLFVTHRHSTLRFAAPLYATLRLCTPRFISRHASPRFGSLRLTYLVGLHYATLVRVTTLRFTTLRFATFRYSTLIFSIYCGPVPRGVNKDARDGLATSRGHHHRRKCRWQAFASPKPGRWQIDLA